MSVLLLSGSPAGPLPKLCGADIELGNFTVGPESIGSTGYEAAQALLAEIPGLPLRSSRYDSYRDGGNACSTRSHGGGYGNGYGRNAGSAYSSGGAGNQGSSHSVARGGPSAYGHGTLSVVSHGNGDHACTGSYSSTAPPASNLQDVGRRFLASNGGSAYIDLAHLELCLPEVRSAFEHVAAWHGMLRLARAALHSANRLRPEDDRIQVLVNNSDGLGNSYGSHMNYLLRRRTWDNIFCRKPHYLQYLASFQASLIVLTGQGKVGAENRRPSVPYQLSQRADYFASLTGPQTTFDRPLVNSRDEALSGRRGNHDDPGAPARLHVIFFDSALAHGSALFRVGPMQLILTLMELGLVNPRLILDDPLDAVLAYSHDPTLKARAPLISGERFTALEVQSSYLEDVRRYAAQGVFEGVVPRAGEIIALWEDTLGKLANGDWMAVAPRLDWVLKLTSIERALDKNPSLDWDSPAVKVIDHLYSSLGEDGLYWAYESSGLAEQLVPPERVAYFTQNPPEDTRAWTRAMLLRRAEPGSVVSVDWDSMTFKLIGCHDWPSYRTIDLADPLGYTQAEAQPIFDQTENFEALLDELEARFAHPAASCEPQPTN